MVEPKEEEVEISPGGDTFKDIVMHQYKIVTGLSNCEFRGGYYTEVPSKTGDSKEIYVEDSREKFSNGCYIFALLFEHKFGKKMEEAFKKFQEELKKIKDDFIKKSSVNEEVILGEGFYTKPQDKILLETYKEKKLNLYLNLFLELSRELSRLNHLGMRGGAF